MVRRPDDDDEPRDEPVARGSSDASDGDATTSPPGSPTGFDERWAELVAQLGEPDAAGQPAVEPPATGEEQRRGGHVVRPAGEPRELSGRDWAGSDQYDAAEEAVDDLEHFVPPDPGPVRPSDPLRGLTWGIAIGVPLLYVLMLLVWHGAPGWVAPVAGVLFVAAVAVLVWRMPARRTDDDDSGAVV